MEPKKSKLTLKGIDESTGIPFIKEIHSLDEVKTSGTYIVIARNATSEENGFPKIHSKADSCFCCEANLVVNCCYNDDESQSSNTYGQELTISDKENNNTGTYKRTVGPAGCSEWLMVATGNIELIAQNNDIVKAYNEVSANYIAAVERIDKAEDTVLISHNTVLESATVRFDRIEENEATINAGEIGSTPSAIVYYKPANKFVAADSAGAYWDAWDGMEAYMSGGAIRKDKVYLCNGISYIYCKFALYPTADTLTDFGDVNNIIKELYSDIDYRKVNHVRIVCAFPTNNKFYNGIYLYGEEGTLAKFESSYDNENIAIDSFNGFLSNKEMAALVSTSNNPFTIDCDARLLRPINIPLNKQIFDLAVSKSLVKDAIIGSAIKELFIDNSIGVEIPPLFVKNLRRNYQGAYSGEYGMLLTDGTGTTYFSFGTTDTSKVVNSVVQLNDTQGTGVKAYVVIDWSALEENKLYNSGVEDVISDEVFNITLQPTINSHLKYAEKSDMIEVAEIVAENTDKIEKKLDATIIKSKNLYDKNAIIYGQGISYSGDTTLGPISTSWSTGATSDFIPVIPLETYYLHRGFDDVDAVFAFVKADKKTILKPLDPATNQILSVTECKNKSRAYKAPEEAAYAIFTIDLANKDINDAKNKASDFQFEIGNNFTEYEEFWVRKVADYPNLPIELEYRHNYPDKLWGKKYVACGDSFTAGDFSGDTTGDYIFTDGKFAGKKKVYPYFIGMRNNMEVTNEAISGSIMALDKTYVSDPENVDINTRKPFSYERYKKIPADADYITLWFGINDSANTNLGTIDDATNETFYGAWNVVMEYLITNHPYAKIGIIITNSGKAEYREAEREIARKWGIPFLDMMGDEHIPPIFGRESNLCLSSVANNLRRNSFIVSSSNGHPNQYAHEYESTFIEEFLRRL